MDEPLDEPIELQQNYENYEQDPESSENIVSDCKENTTSSTEGLEAISSEEKAALLQKELGNRLVELGEWDDAIKAYSRAIEYNPKNIIFYSNRAFCYLKKGWFEEAERDCTIVIALEDSFEKAYYRRSLAYINLDRKADAINDLLKVLTLNPENEESKKLLYTLRNRPNDSVIILRTEEDRKKYAEEFKEKARSCVEIEKWLDAIDFYSKAQEYNEYDPSIYLNRAICSFHAIKYKHAILDCYSAITLNENYVKAYYWRARSKVRLKLYEEAKEDLLKGLKLEPENRHLKKWLKFLEREIQEKKNTVEKTKDFMGYKGGSRSGEYMRFFNYIQEQTKIHRSRGPSSSSDSHIPQSEPLNLNERPKNVDENKFAFQGGSAHPIGPRTYKLYHYHYFPEILKHYDGDLPIPFTFYEFEVGWNSLKPDHTYERLLYFLQINPKQMELKFNKLCSNPSWLHQVIELMLKYSDRGMHFYDHLFGISKLEEFEEVFTGSTETEMENVRKVLDKVAVNEPEKDIKRLKEIYSFVTT